MLEEVMRKEREAFEVPIDPDYDEKAEGFKDGYHAASVTVDEVLSSVRCDIENADLSDSAATAAKLAVEMVSRLWYERKREVAS